jgi:uncharacterized membrane protein YphA (DoxX/SURF4 family)
MAATFGRPQSTMESVRPQKSRRMKSVPGQHSGRGAIFVAIAIWVYGFGAIGMGLVDLVWGAFDPDHQPIQAFGDHVPGSHVLAYVVGVLLVVGGAAVLNRRSARFGAAILAAVYALIAIFWLPRLHTAPMILGQTPKVYIGVLGGVGQELVVICAALIVYAWASPPGSRIERAMPAVRVIFALCTIDFGLQHLTGVTNPSNTEMVPTWMPFGPGFWVVLTGSAFVLAGIAILIGVQDVLAARLLALMFFVFSAVTLLPGLPFDLRDEANWGGNAYEFVVVGSAWILAESLNRTKRRSAKA